MKTSGSERVRLLAQKNSPLVDEARERLLSRVESMQAAERRIARPGAAPRVEMTDFTTLPAYDDVRMQRLVGARLGLVSPYFRLHQGHNAAHTDIDGRAFINFSSYDYLGLNGHPEVIAAAKVAVDRYGISASASRVVAGERSIHRELEQALAGHYGVAGALTFVSGYATNVSVIGHLVGPKDLVVCDAAIHNSAVMGSALSGAARRSFAHNDLDNLDDILKSSRGTYERALIVVEGLYSMDGDYPDLARLIEIKRRHRAWLMVDEAHAIGVLGATGRGLFEHFSIDARDVDVWMGTLSKTLAGCGGYIAGSADLIDYLKHVAGAFVYSVAMPPVIAAACLKALEIMHREPERVARLQRNGMTFFNLVRAKGLNTGNGSGIAICPIVVGDSLPAAVLSQKLFERGVNVQPVLYPAVPPKEAGLRFFLTASHTDEDMAAGVNALADEMNRLDQTMRELKVPGY
jgi:8-amino-7-oxononanoate synthase